MASATATATASTCGNGECENDSSVELWTCGRCKSIMYCSKDCQKLHWPRHIGRCKLISGHGIGPSFVDSFNYYKRFAVHDPKVQTLAEEMCLDTSKSDLSMLLRRLVLTGKDTPENFTLFFGHEISPAMQEEIKEHRHQALLHPPAGSPMYDYHKDLDENCPAWTPRPASSDEADEIAEIRTIQDMIQKDLGSQGLKNVSMRDGWDMLKKNYGDGWSRYVRSFKFALGSLNHEVEH